MKSQSIIKNFVMPQLFLEDLEQIEKIILNELNPQEYKLIVNELEFKDLKSAANSGRDTCEFTIFAKEPDLIIDFSSNYAQMIVNDKADVNNIAGKIMKIISVRERKLTWSESEIMLSFIPIMLTVSMFITVAAVMFEILEEYRLIVSSIVFFVTLGFILVWYQAVRERINKFSDINFFYKKNKRSFWYRYKTQILFAAMSGLIGAVAGTILTTVISSI